MNEATHPSRSPLGHIEALTPAELEHWLERALRGRETLPLAVPGEHPFLAIARCDVELDSITRRDLRHAALLLINTYVRDGDTDDAYVASLLGIVRELDVRGSRPELATLARSERFGSLPRRQRSNVLGTLIDMNISMPDEFWHAQAKVGRHQGLALRGLLSRGLGGLDLLPSFEGDKRIANTIYAVLSLHAQRLDSAYRAQMVRRGAELVGQCSGEIKAAVEDWLREEDPELLADAGPRVSPPRDVTTADAFLQRRRPGTDSTPCRAPARLSAA